MDQAIELLAELIHERNEVAQRITALVGRPAQIGHVGEFIASKVFDIQLEESAVAKGIDGRFRNGPLAGMSVNVKFYAKLEWLLDIRADAIPDYYLVLAGPRTKVASSRGESRLWYIDSVYLFAGQRIYNELFSRNLRIGEATSVMRAHWDTAEIYPHNRNSEFQLTADQRAMLALFGSLSAPDLQNASQ